MTTASAPSSILRWLPWLLLTLLSVGPAWAAELVVYDDGISLSDVSKTVKRELKGTAYVARPLSSLTRSWSRVLLLGDANEIDCFGALDGLEGFQRRVGKAIEALDGLDEAEAGRILSLTRAALPCADEFMPPDALSDLFFLEGIMATYAADATKAKMHFCESAAIHPDRSFDEAYPPDARALFDAGVALGESVEWASVQFDLANLDLRELRLDGIDIAAWSPARSVVPGYHVVQWRDREGAVGTMAFGIGAGKKTLLGTTETLARGILAGPESEVSAGKTAVERLAEAGAQVGAAQVLVLGPTGSNVLVVESATWTRLPPGAPRR